VLAEYPILAKLAVRVLTVHVLGLPAHMESAWEPDKLTSPSALFRNLGILALDIKVLNEELL
jgi:hypothetical protein